MKFKPEQKVEREGMGVAELLFTKLGFAFREQPVSDLGIDAHAELVDEEIATGRLLGIQLKTGSSYLKKKTADGYVFRTDPDHAQYWIDHALPVVVALCDVEAQRIYWESVCKETVVSTGKNAKVIVPFTQRVDETGLESLRSLLSPIVPPATYSILDTRDLSHATAKRYSIALILQGQRTKSEIASILRDATAKSVERTYHRNDLLQGRWGSAKADVVWVFVYPSLEDRVNANWICRSLWIREDLPANARPLPFLGENIGGLITVDWKGDYESIARFTGDNRLTKEQYFAFAIPFMEELNELFHGLKSELDELVTREHSEEEFLSATDQYRMRIHEAYMSANDMGFPPIECERFDEKLMELAAHLDNAAIFFSDRGRSTWPQASDRQHLATQYLRYFEEQLPIVKYELDEVRR